MIYKSKEIAKTGDAIPLFNDGRPMHSKYNPTAEHLPLPQDVCGGFFLIGGIGAGYHIQSLLHTFQNASVFVLAFEPDQESLDFAFQFRTVQELKTLPNVFFCTEEEVSQALLSLYHPALYGTFYCIAQRAWQTRNEEAMQSVKQRAEAVLKTISADYSVQVHFGKIWMHNILMNLRSFDGNNAIPADTRKTAAVIAAGPSLDKTIRTLEQKRSQYFIIATDTAYGTLLRNGIFPDIAVCVDAQHVSSEHFFPCPQNAPKYSTVFVFDISSAPDCVATVRRRGYDVFFIQSGHPLSFQACPNEELPFLETGSGTVTIAAADLARQLGFKRIEIFAADFAYRDGKPYAKGTYLEQQFFSASNRVCPAEQRYARLMYRTELEKKEENTYTSKVMKGYEKSFYAWALQHGYTEEYASSSGSEIRVLQNKSAAPLLKAIKHPFSYTEFINTWLKDLSSVKKISDTYKNKVFATLLPLMAFLENDASIGSPGVVESSKLAYTYATRYNVGL